MKIEINGFVIELTTDDVNLALRVSDASGKELSNNTYAQEQSAEATPVEMPSAENTEVTSSTEATPEATPETSTEEAPVATEEAPAKESVQVPTLEEFKKLLKEGKINPTIKKEIVK